MWLALTSLLIVFFYFDKTVFSLVSSAPWIPLKRVGRLYGVLIRILFTFSKPQNQLKQVDVSYSTFNLDELMMEDEAKN